ncbi:hypothetical protein ACWGM8_31610, partial [Streptomyces albidoflavus]
PRGPGPGHAGQLVAVEPASGRSVAFSKKIKYHHQVVPVPSLRSGTGAQQVKPVMTPQQVVAVLAVAGATRLAADLWQMGIYEEDLPGLCRAVEAAIGGG